MIDQISQETSSTHGVGIYDLKISYYFQFEELLQNIYKLYEQSIYFNTLFRYDINNNDDIFQIQLPQELRYGSFIIFFKEISLITILVKNSEQRDFLMPLIFYFQNYLLIERQIYEKYWKDDDPLIIKAKNLKQFFLMKNYLDDYIQIQNYNFDRIIKISNNQLIFSNYTIYINLESQTISNIETNLSYQMQAIRYQYYKIIFTINKERQKEQEEFIVIKTCCSIIYEFPITIYFKYLFEKENSLLDSEFFEQVRYAPEEFIVYCWGNSNSQQYYRYVALFYARIQNNEDLNKFYQLERQDMMKMFKFSLKELDKPIERESEICLALLTNNQTQAMNTYEIILDDNKYVQKINLEETLYERLYLQNSQNKIIKINYDQGLFNCFIEYQQCGDSFQYYTNNTISEILFIRRISYNNQKLSTKIQITVINQKIKMGQLGISFDLLSSEWIVFELELMTDYQLVSQDQNNLFQFDYELSNFQITYEKCISQQQNQKDIKTGLLTQENNVFNSQEFKFIYVKAGQYYNSQKFQFILKYFSKLSIINTETVEIDQQTLSLYLFNIKYSKKIFKIMNYGNQLFLISKCQLNQKNIKYKPMSRDQDDILKINNYIQNDYLFIYPEICSKKTSDENDLSDQNCLQINQHKELLYQNATGIIEEIITIKLQLNQIFNTQLNSENKFTILELENYQDYYLYLEYEAISDSPVNFELRYLNNRTFLQSFYFKQYQEIQIVQLQNLKYLEIHNYKSNTTFNLILIISEKPFYYTNIYLNTIKLIQKQGQQLLLLSKILDENIIIYLSNKQNVIWQQKMLELKSPENIFIFNNQFNYTIKEINQSGSLKKQFYYLEVDDFDVQIMIKKKKYFIQNTPYDEQATSIQQFSQFQINSFSFKINPSQIKILKKLDILKLLSQQIYFVFARNHLLLKQEYINGINDIDLQQSLIVFKGHVLEQKQVDEEYVINTFFYFSSLQSLQIQDTEHFYFRIYLCMNNSNLLIPFSQIFSQSISSKKQKIVKDVQKQFFIFLVIFLIISILALIFYFRFKKLQNYDYIKKQI
ncbi:transmembrane protein, putative (macronuclear) [Tetrahymena thermophila SB210]|uniref:Transmembrane protein, putative n=1 Tax=Tetrahymena thermophila (strain SB210) TaxID=312017 RepID=I7M7S5_TETTS|nr:transmembrane protein, putative [Tetrahymena thermophila SB210]EAR95761.2 transmembrane protein, putative [Tetrahymena thermophila SB210]|eukprot:XP_001016006.2 transmembrane protein, putative [Tetrahymena thermophila SB210]